MRKNFLSRFAVPVVCMFILQLAGFFFQTARAYAAPPNIILINVDNMGWGDLCSNVTNTEIKPDWCTPTGTTGTQNLDTLAKDGVTLTNFYTPVPICTPSRAALMTGRDPRRYGIISTPSISTGYPNELTTGAWTLAEELKALNYNTAMVGKWQLGFQDIEIGNKGNHSWDQGFEYNYVLPMGVHYDAEGFCLGEKYNNGTLYWQHINGTLPFGGEQRYRDTCPVSTGDKHWTAFNNNEKSLTQILTDKAIQYINNKVRFDSDTDANKDTDPNNDTDPNKVNPVRTLSNPFFLYLAYPAPHSTVFVHVPPDKSPTKSIVRCPSTSPCTPTEAHDQCINKCNITNVHCVHACELDYLYEYAIREIDTQVGRLRSCLDGTLSGCDATLNKTQDTIIIFTSDNGPFTGQSGESYPPRAGRTGGMRGGQKYNYEGGVRVPFIAYWKDHWVNITDPTLATLAERRKQHPADMMDIFTTLVSVVGGIDQYPNQTQTAYVGLDGNKCNSPLSVTNDEGDKIALDGKDISAVLRGYDTCLNKQAKDIHTAWLPAGNVCNRWSWTITSPWSFDYCIDGSTENDNVFGIRSYDPTSTETLSLFDYKLYFDDFLKPVKLYNLQQNPREGIGSDYSTYVDPNIVGDNSYSAKQNTLVLKAREYQREWVHYLPSLKDQYAPGTWENYITVMAKEPVSMNVKLRLYNMEGGLLGQYTYCGDGPPTCNEPAIAPFARVATKPSWVYSKILDYLYVGLKEYSMIIETSASSVVNTNTIANNYKGFDIYEAPKARSVHTFGKNYDGQNYYQVYILVQNIYDTPRNVTFKLIGKTAISPGNGATLTVDIPAFATYKVRPSVIAGGIDFNGTVVVTSNLNAREDGLGLPVPALNRYEVGSEALTIYESADKQPTLYFPHIRDGKFGGTLDDQNFLSVVNPSTNANENANIIIVLYNNSGVEEGRFSYSLGPGQKETWRPSWIKGTQPAPKDFEGSIVIFSYNVPNVDPQSPGNAQTVPVIGQTNVLYPGANAYGVDAFNLYESAMPATTLFFPKAFDNIVSATHLFNNRVYIQNPDAITKTIKIELFDNGGISSGVKESVTISPHQTHVFQPRCYVGAGGVTPTTISGNVAPIPACSLNLDNGILMGTGNFRGSVKVTETSGKNITGVFKYEVHATDKADSKVDAITVFRSMGQ